jgi:Ca2+-binding EF-hand superfamily protein
MRFTAATAMALYLTVAGCQSGLGDQTAEPPSPTRLEYIREFKKIDATNKGRITFDEATAYYSARFTELDKNRDGYLNAKEIEAILPIMNSQSANELMLKLDRDSDNRVSRAEFLVLANWLFQLASSPNELALADVERNMPASVPASTKKDSDDSPSRRIPCPPKAPNC